jgi:hypothetical protein
MTPRFGYNKFAVQAKAGTHPSTAPSAEGWVPAFAGTAVFIVNILDYSGRKAK